MPIPVPPDCSYHQCARTESLTEKRDFGSQAGARDTSEFPRILNILPIFLTLFLVNYEACDFKCSFLHMGKSNIYSYFSSTFNIFHVSRAGGNGETVCGVCVGLPAPIFLLAQECYILHLSPKTTTHYLADTTDTL